MKLSLKKRISGDRTFSAGMAMIFPLIIGTIVSLLSLSIIAILDSSELKNLDLWLTMAAHFIFLIWFCQINFMLFRKARTLKCKLLSSIIFIAISVPLLSVLVTQLQMWCNPDSGFSFNRRMMVMTGTALSDAIIVEIICLLLYWKDSYRIKFKENEQLSLENLNNRIETLKKQLSPHFLFNSLNTLKGLIHADNRTAQEYVDRLASVYRYTIQDKETVRFCEEMEFVGSYIYMLQIRYGKALDIKVDCSPDYDYMWVLPVSIQSLVENAVKHNVVSPSSPLQIRIYTTDDSKVVVWNKVNLRENDNMYNNGTGLSNLFERYRLRFGTGIEIDCSDGCFKVTVPLFRTQKGE